MYSIIVAGNLVQFTLTQKSRTFAAYFEYASRSAYAEYVYIDDSDVIDDSTINVISAVHQSKTLVTDVLLDQHGHFEELKL